jgi:hypothetical protein
MALKRNENSSMNPKWKSAVCGLATAFALMSCEDRVAGTSVGTGNPTEIQVSFKNDSGSVPITGTMNVYASTQIPVAGFSPQPLLSVPVSGAAQAALKADAFKALHDSLWPKTSIVNGEYRFNVVVTGENHGTIMKGLAFRKDKMDFVLRAEDSTAPQTDRVATVMGAMMPLVTFQGVLDTNKMSAVWEYHLFLYGTGYSGKSEGGRFSIPKFPIGKYESHVMLVPTKAQQTSGQDSAVVFDLMAPIEPGVETLLLSANQIHIPLPDSLKKK